MQVYTVKILFPPSFGQKATDKCKCVVAKSKTCSRKEISPNKIRTKKLLLEEITVHSPVLIFS